MHLKFVCFFFRYLHVYGSDPIENYHIWNGHLVACQVVVGML